MTQTIPAQNSEVKINGLKVIQNSNQVSNAITGVTLNLKKAAVGSMVTLNVSDNKDNFKGLVNDFVKKYNDTMTFLNKVSGYNSVTETGGDYQGDAQLRNLKLNLAQTVLNPPISAPTSAIQSLADLGINVNKQGILEVNQTTFNAAFDNNYTQIGALFSKSASATDTNIRVSSVGATAPAGVYPVVLGTYVPGTSITGATIGGLAATSTDGITVRGTDTLNSLYINVLSGSAGARGNIVIQDGLAFQLEDFLDEYDIDDRTSQLNSELKQLEKNQATIDSRRATVELRYTEQFSKLDTLISNLQATSAFLTQSLASFDSRN